MNIERVVAVDVQACRDDRTVCVRIKTENDDFMLSLEIDEADDLSDRLDQAARAVEDPR